MDLESILLPEKVVTFDFPGCEGFKVDLAFLSKETNQSIFKKCRKTKFNTKTRQAEEEFDDELFLELYVGAIIKGWTGFKMKHLNELVLADVGQDPEKEVDYSERNALTLMKSSVIFDNWVSEVISDIGNFTQNNSTKKFKDSKATSKSKDQGSVKSST